jgi:hypothetical protein
MLRGVRLSIDRGDDVALPLDERGAITVRVTAKSPRAVIHAATALAGCDRAALDIARRDLPPPARPSHRHERSRLSRGTTTAERAWAAATCRLVERIAPAGD